MSALEQEVQQSLQVYRYRQLRDTEIGIEIARDTRIAIDIDNRDDIDIDI